MSMPDPYNDYDPERAKYQGVWFIASLVALVIVSGLIYGAAYREDKIASAPASSIQERGTTGSGSSNALIVFSVSINDVLRRPKRAPQIVPLLRRRLAGRRAAREQRRDPAHGDAPVRLLGPLRRDLQILLAVALRGQVFRRHVELLRQRDGDRFRAAVGQATDCPRPRRPRRCGLRSERTSCGFCSITRLRPFGDRRELLHLVGRRAPMSPTRR